MKTLRRIDQRKVDQIKQLIETCKDAGLSTEDTIFAEYKSIPDATRLEHAAANYPLFSFSSLSSGDKKKQIKSIKHDILKLHNNDVRTFNKSVKDLDMEIIGAEYRVPDVYGSEIKIVFDEMAIGAKAKRASDKCDPYIDGWTNKKKRLLKISRDTKLKSRHDAKMREIQRLLDNRKGKKK